MLLAFFPDAQAFADLGMALAIGLLIGLERGWEKRELPEGKRVAGLRTYGVVGLLGGAAALLGEHAGPVLPAVVFAALAAALLCGYLVSARATGDVGVTSLLAALLTFVLGAMIPQGHRALAAAAAVTLMVLLGLKGVLHRALEKIEERELHAAFQLLLISVVVLPVLPDRTLDPWGALNPYELWWMVVLIAGISFAGYVGIKTIGPRLGTAATALLGGLVSSTALTLDFARRGEKSPRMQVLLASGVVLACSTMFPRILIEVGAVNSALLPRLLLPVAAMGLVGYGGAVWLWLRARGQDVDEELDVGRPLDLWTAVRFGAFLAVVLLAAAGLRRWVGEAGLYALAAASGLADVDAITLSYARMARDGLPDDVAALGILVAAASNTVVKCGFVLVIAGWAMARRVALVLGIALAVGAALLVLT